MGKDVMMSTKEAQRFALIQQVLSKTTTQGAAALALGLSERQIKRLCRKVREHGAQGQHRKFKRPPKPDDQTAASQRTKPLAR
jgi:hypothetical protein